ncbi:ABC transporter substrate-binding protein [Frankia sp. R43]|uniref:ABC transporter substrate-binding protein n=1 Tax=Frankia sp. R43 TaxID=269536 RepID=UPI000B0D9ED4|nr:ABC transporter substrate-binding protein [Frankia sp. R43]
MVRVFRLLGSRLRVGVAALVAVVAVVAVTACGSDSDDAPAATTATGRPDLSGVTLRVADQVGQLKALLEASGVLADVPYKIEWSDFSAAAPLLQALRAGAADIGQAGDAPILNALGAGAPLKVVGAARTSPKGVAILVPKDSPIRTVADLRGKTVSPSTEGSIGHYLLLGALKEAGLTPDDLTISFLAPPARSWPRRPRRLPLTLTRSTPGRPGIPTSRSPNARAPASSATARGSTAAWASSSPPRTRSRTRGPRRRSPTS